VPKAESLIVLENVALQELVWHAGAAGGKIQEKLDGMIG
jgi:hypothetical protein